MKQDELNKLIDDVQDLANRIKSIDNLILSIDNVELKQQYSQDLLNMIGSYSRLLLFLESELKAYAKTEREDKVPVNLRYRRILKHLQSSPPSSGKHA